MKRLPFLATVLLTFAFAAPAQDTMKKEAAIKPADPESKVVLDSWNEIGRKLIAMAEDFPEDKYDFKPTPAQRSFAEQLLHMAVSCYYFTNAATGQKLPHRRIRNARNTSPRPSSLRSSRKPSPMAQPPSSRKATTA
jgi:hypothetical protein